MRTLSRYLAFLLRAYAIRFAELAAYRDRIEAEAQGLLDITETALWDIGHVVFPNQKPPWYLYKNPVWDIVAIMYNPITQKVNDVRMESSCTQLKKKAIQEIVKSFYNYGDSTDPSVNAYQIEECISTQIRVKKHDKIIIRILPELALMICISDIRKDSDRLKDPLSFETELPVSSVTSQADRKHVEKHNHTAARWIIIIMFIGTYVALFMVLNQDLSWLAKLGNVAGMCMLLMVTSSRDILYGEPSTLELKSRIDAWNGSV